MKRDMRLIHLILLSLEKRPQPWELAHAIVSDLPDVSDELVRYHLDLCQQAGFVNSRRSQTEYQLAWAGHEKLAELKDSKP